MSSAETTAEEEAEVTEADLMTSSTDAADSPLPEKTSQSSSSGEQISLPDPSTSVTDVSIDIMAAVTPPRSLCERDRTVRFRDYCMQ